MVPEVKKNERPQAITRIIVTAILFINAMLTATGKNPLPIDEGAIGTFISAAFSAASVVWVWWKDNNITPKAIFWWKKKNESVH